MTFLLGTNVLSELRKFAACRPGMQIWPEAQSSRKFSASVLALAAIGIFFSSSENSRAAPTNRACFHTPATAAK